MLIDCRNLLSPKPLLRTKKALEELPSGKLTVLLNSSASIENIELFAKSRGCEIRKEDRGDMHAITFTKCAPVSAISAGSAPAGSAASAVSVPSGATVPMKTKQIFVGSVPIGGGAPISVQSMTFSKTSDVQATLEQIRRLYFAGCDIVRVSVPDAKSAAALKALKAESPLPLVADIHFNYRLALTAALSVDCIRINPGNIGGRARVCEVVNACKERNIPIRIGVNSGSLEKPIEAKYGSGARAMCESALYHIKLLEDLDFTAIKVSMKASDVRRTVDAYRLLRPQVCYPFHLGLTEAGTAFHAGLKSAIALGSLLLEGIGDTMRVSITGELEEEIRVARAILQDSGVQPSGVNIIACPTCARLESDLKNAVAEVEKRTAHITKPLTLAVMGCAVNALGEAKHADAAIAFGKQSGLVIVRGAIIGKFSEPELLERFMNEVEKLANERRGSE